MRTPASRLAPIIHKVSPSFTSLDVSNVEKWVKSAPIHPLIVLPPPTTPGSGPASHSHLRGHEWPVRHLPESKVNTYRRYQDPYMEDPCSSTWLRSKERKCETMASSSLSITRAGVYPRCSGVEWCLLDTTSNNKHLTSKFFFQPHPFTLAATTTTTMLLPTSPTNPSATNNSVTAMMAKLK